MSNDQWRQHQEKLFASGEHFLPEYFKSIVLPGHYAHLHPDKSGTLRYIKTQDNGREGLYSRISIRGYLEKYRQDKYTSRNIDDLVAIFNALIQDEDGLKFAVTSEEIVGVYTKYNLDRPHLSSSCMRGLFIHLPHHPTYVYGTGDLAVAYLSNREGLTEERAVCWPTKKIYGRVFGTGLLHGLLQKRGYKKSRYYPDGEGSFLGARLLAIPIPHNNNVYLMPYIDEKLWAIRQDNYLVLADGSIPKEQYYSIRYQSGTTVESPVVRIPCFVCGVPKARDELFRVFSKDEKGEYPSNLWCMTCAKNHSFTDSLDGHFYDSKTVELVIMSDGKKWSERSFAHYGFVCGDTGLKYHVDNRIWVYDENDIPTAWSTQSIETKAYWCSKSGYYYNNSVPKVIMYNGDNWTKKNFDSFGGVCQRSGLNYSKSIIRAVRMKDDTIQGWGRNCLEIDAYYCYLSQAYFSKEVPSILLANFLGKLAAKHIAIERGYIIQEDGTGTI